jgi:hypothetical protein
VTVGTTGVHDHPPPTRGEYAGPPLAPQNGHASEAGRQAWIVVGPRTRAHAARVLEQSLAPVWVALLETSGVPEGQGWRLVLGECHLEPEPSGPSPGPPSGAPEA